MSGSSLPPSPEKLNFTAHYGHQQSVDHNELEEYFRMTPEFPNLCRLAHDIMTISGSAVAVERIFSSSRDTISFRRASLKPDTIQTLMLVKQKLKLARHAVQEILADK
ncbi:hypothetical protein M422DRAFT_243527 [Sphaerobolus stellatus SS14]|nr:hypothetical protein M422DRAFT_243527 [Sphaerobolus stellatus SS14]